jgi:hydroxylaminobenzene mutase
VTVPSNDRQRLIWYGVVLFLLGLITEIVMYFVINPRMALSAHLVALISGMFLILLGLIRNDMDCPGAWSRVAFWLFVYSTYSAWGSMFFASIFGTSRHTPFASKGVVGAAVWQENIADLSYMSFFITIVLTCVVALWGLRRGMLRNVAAAA